MGRDLKMWYQSTTLAVETLGFGQVSTSSIIMLPIATPEDGSRFVVLLATALVGPSNVFVSSTKPYYEASRSGGGSPESCRS